MVVSGEGKLVALFSELSESDQQALLAFAEFLSQRSGPDITAVSLVTVEELAEPEDIPRPNEERVVAAVKRLAKTYPMLNKSKMLSETSELVTGHIMHGREAPDVIDELESLFRREYELLITDSGDS